MGVHAACAPWRAVAVLVVAATAGGCATSPTPGAPAPIVERSRPAGDPAPAHYVVRPRDSLYAIAWRFGLDYVAVARWNGIGPPYTIYPGQTLVLRRGASATQPSATQASRTPEESHIPERRAEVAPAVRPAPTSPTARETTAPAPRRTVTPTRPVVRAPTVPEGPAARAEPAKSPTPPESARPVPQPARAAAETPASGSTGARWRWPVDVQPERGFGGDNKGVDYAVPSGRPVVVAAPGRVVYSGPGLAGFRHLVIVEHGGGYLSAYSLNADPAVGEGADLAGGAQLAAIGGAGPTDRKLHFEVRRNGSPIDPGRVIGR